MRLKSRHYVLLALLLGLGIFNLIRYEQVKHTPGAKPGELSRGSSPAWDAFDKAAIARDADDATFLPAFKALGEAIDTASAEKFPPRDDAPELDGLRGCKTWLEVYRHEHLHPSVNGPGWVDKAKTHVDSCQATHRDSSK